MTNLTNETKLRKALEKLVPHVLHYASMPHAHSDADRDVANARQVLRECAEVAGGEEPTGPSAEPVEKWVDPAVERAAQAAKESPGAAATFLRRDQCSHAHGNEEERALYQELLVEMHKLGDILKAKPRGTYANMDGLMLWVSPLKSTPGADVFIYGPGGFDPEPDGNGVYPLAYFDELGVSSEVVETTAGLRKWLSNPVFGQMSPDYLLDQVASFADCCKYEEFNGDGREKNVARPQG